MGRSFVKRAEMLGREHGENAAAWWLQETPVGGRNSAGGPEAEAWARETLARMDAGDDCGIPMSDLSGEWADGFTPRRLAEEIGYDHENDNREEHAFLCSTLCDAYELGFGEACDAAVVKSLKMHAQAVKS